MEKNQITEVRAQVNKIRQERRAFNATLDNIDAVISVLPPPPKSFGEIFGGSPLGLAKALAKKKD